jgi:hypothetical protein
MLLVLGFTLIISERLEALSPLELETLDREVFADPEVKESFEKQYPSFKPRYLDLLRKDRIRKRLNLPDPPES